MHQPKRTREENKKNRKIIDKKIEMIIEESMESRKITRHEQ